MWAIFRTRRVPPPFHHLLACPHHPASARLRHGLPQLRTKTTTPPKPDRLSVLAATISQTTEIIRKHLQDNDIPSPTFSRDQANFDAPLPAPIEAARTTLQEASLELHELTLGPRAFMQDLIFRDTAGFLTALHRFGLAARVPLDRPAGIAYAALAGQLGVDPDALRRLCRCAVAHRVFVEPSPDALAHNANSAALVRHPALLDWVGVATQDILPMLPRLAAALEQFPAADEPAEAVGSVEDPDGEGGRMPFYLALARDPDRAARFARGMRFHGQSAGYGVQHLVTGFDWAGLGDGAVVVDLGGAHGDAARAVVAEFPRVRFVVQDLPDTVRSAVAAASSGPSPVPDPPPPNLNPGDGGEGEEDVVRRWVREKPRERIAFMAHDFFRPQPVIGADVYLFRWIWHNWPDKYCVRMLRALVPALRPGARVLVMDDVLPPFGRDGYGCGERRLRMLDAVMMALGNAREREEEEFRALFTAADGRFRYVGKCMPEGSRMTVFEAVWDPSNTC